MAGVEPRKVSFTYRRLPDQASQIESTVLDSSSQMLILAHRLQPRNDVVAMGETVITRGDLAVWFLFRGKSYDVARVYSPTGGFLGFYVDALEPVTWRDADPGTIEPLVDLFLDVWVWPDLRFSVLDEDEFDLSMKRGWLSKSQSALAAKTIHTIVNEVEAGRFPPAVVMDYEIEPAELELLAQA